MTTWEQYLEQQEIAAVGRWIDELAAEPSCNPEDIANTVIDDGTDFVHPAMFDEIVDYVTRKRRHV